MFSLFLLPFEHGVLFGMGMIPMNIGRDGTLFKVAAENYKMGLRWGWSPRSIYSLST